MEDSSNIKLTRREFLIAGATSAAAATLPSAVTAQPVGVRPPVVSKVSFVVNGRKQALDVDTRTTLLALVGLGVILSGLVMVFRRS